MGLVSLPFLREFSGSEKTRAYTEKGDRGDRLADEQKEFFQEWMAYVVLLGRMEMAAWSADGVGL